MHIRSTKLITGSVIILLCILFSGKPMFAQQVIPAFTDIVTYINGDTTASGARKNVSYLLNKDSVYFALGTIQSNFDLSIYATGSGSSAPQIIILTNGSGNNAEIFKPHKNLYLEGLYMSGVDASGKQVSQVIESGSTNIRIGLKNCRIDSVQSRMLLINQDTCSVFLEDCYMSNTASSSHGGRIIDARETILDSVSIVNCTFYNVMHCVINRFSGGEKYFKYDHNTAYNFPRSILRIDVCPEIIVTNNLFLQTGFAGYIPAWDLPIDTLDNGDRDEWSRIEIWPLENSPFSGYTQKVDFKKNNFWLDPSIPAAYPDTIRPYVTLDFPFEKTLIGADTLTWLNENVNFTNVPGCEYLKMCKEEWADGSPQTNPGFTDNTRPYYFTYSTTSKSYTAAEGGYPLGDLNWWPEKKAQWLSGLTDVKVVKNLPSRFSLEQNYPNPFNPSTVIKYSIPEASRVTLKIFNVLGKEVATLVNANQKTGEYSVTLNADKMASGVYFYSITAGNFVSTKKMILVK